MSDATDTATAPTKPGDGEPDEPAEQPAGATGQTPVPKVALRDLLAHARPYRGALALGLLVAVVANGALLAQPLAIRWVLEAVAKHRSVVGPVLALVGVFLVSASFSGLRSFLLARLGEAIVRDLRVRLGTHLLRLPVQAHDRHRAGDLLSRVSSDTFLLRGILTTGPVTALTGALTLAGALALMGLIDWLLLLLTLGVVALAFSVFFFVVPQAKRASIEAQASLGRLTAVLDRALRAIRTVKAARAEEREAADLVAQARIAYQAGVRMGRVQATIDPAVAFAVQGSFLVVLGIGGQRVAAGRLTVADLVAFLLYLTTLIVPLVAVGQFFTDLQRGLGAYGRIAEILDLEPEPLTAEATTGARRDPAASGAASVRFERVSFAYGPERPILREVSFTVPAGSRTAIVGPSGTGKSTLLALLERFYEPDAGRILLDGEDLRAVPLPELRRAVAYVEQEAPVLAGTVGENLRYGHPDADDAAVQEVLRQVGLRGFVARLPRGLDTDVGDAGVLMSGGERQRIAIGRALLAAPRVLLLDEATSQLDALNEQALRVTVSRIAGPRCTVIVVAHRLSTVVDADQIVVLRDGRVQGHGTHAELLRDDPFYRELVEGQFFPTALDVVAAGELPGGLLLAAPEGFDEDEW
jgi:ABC-type multidrug transport system fused ATPase/permease subunit